MTAADQDGSEAEDGERPGRLFADRILFQEEMSWRELDALDREHTVFFLTLSPLEQHGPHLPVGTDLFTSRAFAAATAGQLCRMHPEWVAVHSPVLPLGSDAFDYLGSIPVRRRVVRDLLIDYLEGLARYDFRYFLIFNSHGGPGHRMAIDEACDWISRTYDVCAFAPLSPILSDLFEGEFHERLVRNLEGLQPAALDLGQDQHAGHWETSLMLRLHPELVDPGYTKLERVLIPEQHLDEEAARNEGHRLGYFGDPSLAHKGLGEASIEVVADEVLRLFLAILEDPGRLADFKPALWDRRVVYRTDFMRWVLALLVALFALASGALLILLKN